MKRLAASIGYAALLIFASPALAQKAPMTVTPPTAAKSPSSITHHGVTIADDYAWLRDPKYPVVDDATILDHLKAENAYFEAQMVPHAPLVETIFQEMKGRIKEDESSVPQKDGDWLYWRRFQKGAQYKQWMRKPVAGGDDVVMLDEAKEAEGKEYFRLGAIAITKDGRTMAYATDTDGSERFTVRFRDLMTGAALPGEIAGINGSLVFSTDGKHLF